MGKYAAILKYNSNHDPRSGRFTSGSSGSKYPPLRDKNRNFRIDNGVSIDTPGNRRRGKWLDGVIAGARPARSQRRPRVTTFGFNQVLRGPSAYQ